jgi:hypothetical protein
MAVDVRKAKSALAKAQKALLALEKSRPPARAGAAFAGKQPPRANRQAVARLESAYQDLSKAIGAAAKITPANTARAPLGQFFESVSKGLVDAQQAMDDRSRDYLKSVAGKPYLLPSVFRIPKLSASVKFAIETVANETVNLVFYRDETTTQTQNQQSIEFDIVSAPLLPGASVVPFSVAPLIDADGRGRVLD